MADDTEASIFEMINKLGGVDKFQSNPFAFIGEVFKHPDLLAKIDKLSKTPEMQKQIAESMNNPMFQQIVGNNPLLSGMMNDYKNRQANGADSDVVDAEVADVDASDDDEDDEDDDEIECDEDGLQVNGYDFSIPGWKPVDWLNPVSNQPFNIPDNEEKRVHFADILDELPEECRERVEIIAEKRLQLHLNPLQIGQLESMADSKGLVPLDLMATLGGFIGEVCYCATLLMPDDDLCDLAKFALASLHRRSGFPVSSYLTQNLLYLDSFDDIEESDWMNFIWSLSGNPVSGRDGNFVALWDDVSLISEIAAENLANEPEMFLGVCLGMLNWSELDLKGIDKPLQTLLANFDDKTAMRNLIMNCLNGQKLYAMQLMSMRDAVKNDALEFILANDGLNALLEKAALWPASCAELAGVIVNKLPELWSKADAERRDAFLMHATHMDSEELAFAALNAGAKFQPEKYRLMALDSQYESIKKRAETLGK